MLAFYLGGLGKNLYEPFVGAVFFTTIYVASLCGRTNKFIRLVAAFSMSWILYIWACYLCDLQLERYYACFSEASDQLPILTTITFGYAVQTLLSLAAAALAFFGKEKIVTVGDEKSGIH